MHHSSLRLQGVLREGEWELNTSHRIKATEPIFAESFAVSRSGCPDSFRPGLNDLSEHLASLLEPCERVVPVQEVLESLVDFSVLLKQHVRPHSDDLDEGTGVLEQFGHLEAVAVSTGNCYYG
jgi:hypothetical protein